MTLENINTLVNSTTIDNEPAVVQPKSWFFKINAIQNDYNSRCLGQTYLRFVLSTDKRSWTRADQLVGAEELSEAAYVYVGGMFRSHERHSATQVRVKLYEGQYVARMNRGGKKATYLSQVRSFVDPETGKVVASLEEVAFSSVRNANGNWDIKVSDDDFDLHEILPSLRD